MLAITYTPEDLRLLEAADIAESSEKYDQRNWGGFCGTPACMLGGYAWKHPESAAHAYLTSGDGGSRDVMAEFGITKLEWVGLFGTRGCGDAGTDGKQAAAYVRRFVEERAKERLRT